MKGLSPGSGQRENKRGGLLCFNSSVSQPKLPLHVSVYYAARDDDDDAPNRRTKHTSRNTMCSLFPAAWLSSHHQSQSLSFLLLCGQGSKR